MRRWLALVALPLAITGFYWKLTLTRQYTWLASPDLTQQVLPWFQSQARDWRTQWFPLWDAYSWAGQPMLGQAQPGSSYPPNWLLFLMPLDNGQISWTVLNWYFVIIRVAAALAFYALCRDVGRSRTASFAAGMLYAAAGFVANTDWPQMVNGTVWVPLALLYQLRAMRGVTPLPSAILSGFFLGLTWLAGHHQVPLYVTLASVALWAFAALSKRSAREAISAVTALAVTGLTSAFLLLPAIEYGRLARRWVGTPEPLPWRDVIPYPIAGDFSLKPLSLWSIVVPGTELNVLPFIGVAAATLAFIGLVRQWGVQATRVFGALALGGVVFSLGDSSVFHGVLYSIVPMLEKARVPAQGMILFHVGVCALFASGLDALAGLSQRASAWIGGSLAFAGVQLGLGGLYLFQIKAVSPEGDTRFMITALSAVLAGAILVAAGRSALSVRAASVFLFSLVLLETGNVTGYNWAHRSDSKRMAGLRAMSEDADLRAFLSAQRDRPRFTYDIDAIPHNLGHWWGLEAFTAYTASAPDLLWRRHPFHPRVRSLLGVRYHIGTKPAADGSAEVLKGASGRMLYQYPDYQPRVWTVHRAEQVPDRVINDKLADSRINLAEQTFSTLPVGPPEQCPGADHVRLTEHWSDSAVIEVNMACRGIVVLNDQFFPGWIARVDGSGAPIIDAYGLVRGVEVAAGRHTIEFSYEPRSAYIGGALSGLGLLLALTAAFFERR